MYIPHHFTFDDSKEKIEFMKQYSFATIVTANDNVPVATQLPFVVEDSSEKLILSSHFALANGQSKLIGTNASLVIFTGPHAYISPAHYDRHESVPTWNYIAVHAYGKVKIIEDENAKIRLLQQMICFYEKEYMLQWESLSDKYKRGMLKGIVAFEMEVTELQGQKKLSQNKTTVERSRITDHLEESGNAVEKDLAGYMNRLNSF